jgi:hypothetical protein
VDSLIYPAQHTSKAHHMIALAAELQRAKPGVFLDPLRKLRQPPAMQRKVLEDELSYIERGYCSFCGLTPASEVPFRLSRLVHKWGPDLLWWSADRCS